MQISQQLVQSKKKNLQEVRHSDWWQKWETRRNADSSHVSLNSLQMICNTFCGFQPLAIILTGKLDNIHKYKSNYFFWDDSKKEC